MNICVKIDVMMFYFRLATRKNQNQGRCYSTHKDHPTRRQLCVREILRVTITRKVLQWDYAYPVKDMRKQ